MRWVANDDIVCGLKPQTLGRELRHCLGMAGKDIDNGIAKRVDKRSVGRSAIPSVNMPSDNPADDLRPHSCPMWRRASVHQLQLVLYVLKKALGFLTMKAAQGYKLPV
jgi:hypothetical protein